MSKKRKRPRDKKRRGHDVLPRDENRCYIGKNNRGPSLNMTREQKKFLLSLGNKISHLNNLRKHCAKAYHYAFVEGYLRGLEILDTERPYFRGANLRRLQAMGWSAGFEAQLSIDLDYRENIRRQCVMAGLSTHKKPIDSEVEEYRKFKREKRDKNVDLEF